MPSNSLVSTSDPRIDGNYPRLTEKRLLKLQRFLTKQAEEKQQESSKEHENQNEGDELFIVRPTKTLCDLRVEELFIHGDDKFFDDKYSYNAEEEEERQQQKQQQHHQHHRQRINEKENYHNEENSMVTASLNENTQDQQHYTSNTTTNQPNETSMNISSEAQGGKTTTTTTTAIIHKNQPDQSESQLQIDQSLFLKVSLHIHNGGGGIVSRIFDPDDTALLYDDKEKFRHLKNREKESSCGKEEVLKGLQDEITINSDDTRGIQVTNKKKKSIVSPVGKIRRKPTIKLLRKGKSKHWVNPVSNRLQIDSSRTIGKKEKVKSTKTSFNLKFPNLNL